MRHIEEKIVFFIFKMFGAVVVLILFTIVGYIFIKGIGAINLKFFFGDANPLYVILGKERVFNGIWNAILGTVALVILAIAFSIPFGILGAVYLHEYATSSKISRIIRFSADCLAGLPSIVFGLFGYAIAVETIGPCLLIGALTLSFIVLPIIIKATEEGLKTVPNEIREGSFALGATKWQTTYKVVLPMALPQIITGIILSMGRCAEETAAIMFTAATAFTFGIGLFDRIEALPFTLYLLATEYTSQKELQMAYGVALVLIMLMFFLFGIAHIIRNKYSTLK
ncbi:phosphate ABC transporter permease PstA [Methanocaldococcus sp.]